MISCGGERVSANLSPAPGPNLIAMESLHVIRRSHTEQWVGKLNEQVISGPADAGVSLSTRSEPVQEVELKLLASLAALGHLHEAAAIQRYAHTAGTSRRLEAVYYDTPDRTLFRQGLTLRVRRHGRHYIQTLKRGRVPEKPFVREEWETSVDSIVPNLGLLPTLRLGPLPEELAQSTLNPVFVTKVRRRTRWLELAGAQVEVAFDEGSIEVGDLCVPLAEVELEMKSGDARAIYDLGIDLIETSPRPEARRHGYTRI